MCINEVVAYEWRNVFSLSICNRDFQGLPYVIFF